jgi:hypothetical protein
VRQSTPPGQAPCGQQCFACRHARRTGAAAMSAAAGVPPRRTQCTGAADSASGPRIATSPYPSSQGSQRSAAQCIPTAPWHWDWPCARGAA